MTQLEIDLNNLAHNYNYLRQKLASNTKFIAVVKANAYGQGAIEIAQKLVSLGTDWLAVAYTEEGISLRQAGIQSPILVFYPQFENIDRLIEHQLEPALYSSAFISAFSKALHAKNITDYPVHLKCNTGLNRIGISKEDLDSFLAQKEAFPFKIQSVYSHLGASENPKPCTFTTQQIKRFLVLKNKLEKAYSKPPLFHLVNTSGIFNYPEYHFDAVRCGIGLYGFANHPNWDKSLLPIARLSSAIVQLHRVEKGESVGYNQGWIAPQKSQIAVLPIGHADGISRRFGKEVGGVWINGQHAPIVGNVCMDMIMVDVTNINCELHQRAIIFDAEHTAHLIAKNAGTISYELLTALSPRIKRSIL